MAAHTTLLSALFLQDKPILGSTGLALRDNHVAQGQGATGAAVHETSWHPYDMVSYGDGSDGVIYDFAVDGVLTSITSPDFEDGYEYQFFFDGLDFDAGTPPLPLRIDVYRETSADYLQVYADDIGAPNYSMFEFLWPRVSRRYHVATATLGISPDTPMDLTTAQKILRVRFRDGGASSNFGGGKIIMRKRVAT